MYTNDVIHYKIVAANPQAHLYSLTLTITSPHPEGQQLSLPAWIPGSYMIRDFAKNVVQIRARDSEKPLSIIKLDKQTWRLEPASGEITVEYEIYAFDPSVRTAYLDRNRAYFNGTSVFFTVSGREHALHRVQIVPAEGDAHKDWSVATTLPALDVDAKGFGTYEAKNYDHLIDNPVEISKLNRFGFSVEDCPHEVVISGRHTVDKERLANDLQKICASQATLFGGLPFERYLFLTYVVGEGYGGLEHETCCSLISKRDDLPKPGDTKMSEGYRRFLGLCSHEYFHLWNVKRIRPDVLRPYKLGQEVYTRLLWAFEGITSYYDDLIMRRSGCIDDLSYLELLAQNITRVFRGNGRTKQSLEDSSFDAWTKFYKQDENSPNAIVSYYAKGALFSLTLDLTIRVRSNGDKSLDDVMRALWNEFGRTEKGVPEGYFERLVADVTGFDLSSLFEIGLRRTDDLPLQALLADFGIDMTLRAAKDAKDQGTSAAQEQKKDASNTKVPRVLGAKFAANSNPLELAFVFDDGAAQQSGLSARDVIVAVGGLKATAANIDQLINESPETVIVHAFRGDELLEFSVAPRPAPQDTCELVLRSDVGEDVLKRRKAWLSQSVE